MYENGARAMKELKSLELLHKPLIETTSVVARTCNSATLKAEFRNRVGLASVGGNSPSICGWIV